MPKHDARPLREGKVQHHGRFAFLLSEEEGGEDLMLRGPTLGLAMDGDRVQARLTPGDPGRPVGEIVRVVTRARQSVTGVLRKLGRHWLATPEGSDARDAVRVVGFARGLASREGDVVVVRITQWPTLRETAGGEVCEVLGRPDEAGVRLRAILRTLGLPESFPEPVLAESRVFPAEVSPAMWEGRRDLRGLPVFTIDGEDAKDFDDAVSLEALGPQAMRLGVHIADVSHYVRKGTALDAEAARRATSVYLADRVVPMLPPSLSERLCSLMPGVERLTLSCFIDLDADGKALASSLEETVIRSRRRFTYEEVEALLHAKSVPDVDPQVHETVLRMGTLYKALNRLRMKRGALDMSMPEYKVRVDARGRPLEVVKRARLGSHRLIEEFMLAANEAVAARLLERGLPFLSRVHPDPDGRRLLALGTELRKMGVHAPASIATSQSAALQAVLAKAVGHPLEETINMLVMRSLKLAAYSHVPGGHFGLASKAYCHFTSPIRRYPDLLTHRAVKALLRQRLPDPLALQAQAKGERPRQRPDESPAAGLKEHGVHCSERERVATDAERRSVDILRAELLEKKVGQVFSGVVSGSAAFGLFVTLPDSGASGLVRGASATLGSRVRVRLDRVNAGKGELDLSFADPGRPALSAPPPAPLHPLPPRHPRQPWPAPGKPGPGQAKPKHDAPRPSDHPRPRRTAGEPGRDAKPTHGPSRQPKPPHGKPKFYERFLKKKRGRR
ncbi:MAG: VacB/RNase II family 3'-5' exoribonuclease [Elusimicrobia bacterium]|nr:VacB/RNase II family 3'-5' exoribonuclease [Elusimicrobiota bacterium]